MSHSDNSNTAEKLHRRVQQLEQDMQQLALLLQEERGRYDDLENEFTDIRYDLNLSEQRCERLDKENTHLKNKLRKREQDNLQLMAQLAFVSPAETTEQQQRQPSKQRMRRRASAGAGLYNIDHNNATQDHFKPASLFGYRSSDNDEDDEGQNSNEVNNSVRSSTQGVVTASITSLFGGGASGGESSASEYRPSGRTPRRNSMTQSLQRMQQQVTQQVQSATQQVQTIQLPTMGGIVSSVTESMRKEEIVTTTTDEDTSERPLRQRMSRRGSV